MNCKSHITQQADGTAPAVHCRACNVRRRLQPGEVFVCPAGRRIACGPGCQLRRSLSWFVRDDGKCGCDSFAAKMDAWGPDVCESKMDEIVAHLLEQAAKKSVFLGAVPAVTVVPLVRRAIDAARAELQSPPS